MLSKVIKFLRPSVAPVMSRSADTLILSNGPNASVTYLLDPFFARQGQSTTYIDTSKAPPAHFSDSLCRAAVIVRYLSPEWIKPLRRFHANGGTLVYFMDDDLMDLAAIAGLPPAYAKKIKKLAIGQRSTLEALCSEFWVSSPYLAEKYKEWMPRLLAPRPSMSNLLAVSGMTLCYHGTASHQAEMNWLAPIIAAVQSQNPDTHFEVFGDHTVNKLYRDIPRTSILHPMSWANYLPYTASVQRDIALAPLLPSPFNAGRGPTKFLDFVRMGAVGIYSNVEPYRGFIRDGVDGILLENDPVSWMRTITMLAGNEPLRRGMAETARQRALEMAFESPCNDG